MILRPVPVSRILVLAVGCALSILVARALSLPNALSCGVIAILSLQDTKRATLRGTAERLIAYAIAVALAFLCFSLLGYGLPAFLAYLLPFAVLCYKFSLQAWLPVCTVLVMHFWGAEQMGLSLILTETALMVIGSGVGVGLTLLLPRPLSIIRDSQREIERELRSVLLSIARAIEIPELFPHLWDHYMELFSTLRNGRERIDRAVGNTLTDDLRYYVRYIELRFSQYAVLERVYHTLEGLDPERPSQAEKIAALYHSVSDHLHEHNDAQALLKQVSIQRYHFERHEALPQTRKEFEARAVLFMLLEDLDQFLELKKGFADSLSVDDRRKYWKRDETL